MDFLRGKYHWASATFTRPADTTAYTSGDVVNNSTSAPVIMTFPNAGSGEGAIIQTATLFSSANQATKLAGELWLFDTAMTMDNDNAVFTPTDAESLTLIAVIAFPASAWVVGDATSGASGNALCNAQQLYIPFRTVLGATPDPNIYGVLVARNAYTPVSAEVFTIRLGVIQ